MWSWIYTFFQWLPVWYVTLGIAVSAVIIPLLWKSLGHALNENEDVAVLVLPMLIFTVMGGVFVVTSSGWWALPLGWATIFAVDGIIWTARKITQLVPRAWAWCKTKATELHAKRENNPRRILTRCKTQFKDAQSRRVQVPMEEVKGPDGDEAIKKIATEVVGFDQAGDNLLEFLGQLFGLVHDIDEFMMMSAQHGAHRTRDEAIFKHVSAGQLIQLLGIDSFDQATLEQWRRRSQTIIEAVVLYFDELPAHVAAANIYHKALQIKGLQEHLAKALPKSTSSTGVIAELETGQLQARLLDELMGKGPEPVPVVTVPHAVQESNIHQFVSGGGGVRTKK